MKILREYNQYTLIEVESSKGYMLYYIIDGDSISEYFHELEAQYYTSMKEQDFIWMCQGFFI